jgi:hypothetical protein
VPIGFLTNAARERLDSFPAQITRGDILTDFTRSRAYRRQIPRTASAANRLGFALQLGALLTGRKRVSRERWNRFAATGDAGSRGL